jgi:TatD DNase family protein
VVVHCFTGTGEELDECIAAGYYIGITGWLCDERRGLHLREIVARIPEDRLLIETDAPYLLPRTVKPAPSHRRNEPMYLRHIVEELARDRAEAVAHTASISTTNARRFFGLPPVLDKREPD